MTIKLKAQLPLRKSFKPVGLSKVKYASAYLILPSKLHKKLKKLSQKAKICESYVFRDVLDQYFKKLEKGKIVLNPPCHKSNIPGNCITKSRTIWKYQDLKLRELVDQTGVSRAEMMRQAVELF